MTGFDKLSKRTLAATMLMISLGLGAPVNAAPEPDQVLLKVMQRDVATQLSRISSELSTQLEASISQSLTELEIITVLESRQAVLSMSEQGTETANNRVFNIDDNR